MRRKHRGAYAREEYSWQSKCRSWQNYSALKERERDDWKARAEKAEARAEMAEVQLAGCLTAAEGCVTPGLVAVKGDYGWSPAYQAVVDVRRERDALRAELASVKDDVNNLRADCETMKQIAKEASSKYLQAKDEMLWWKDSFKGNMDYIAKLVAERNALRADGEKYRRLCELMKKYDAEVFWTSLGWRAFLLGSTSSVRNLDDPLTALEAAVRKAKEDKDGH